MLPPAGALRLSPVLPVWPLPVVVVRRYTNHIQAKEDRAAWLVVQRHLPLFNEEQCRAVVTAWEQQNRRLYSDDYYDTKDRKTAKRAVC
jgi:hypothetical protein